ncbi:hypothetical protein CBI38_24425 [Rhodococcus oxybenzonivorans]|uniref:Transmembrane protein n=1 Tax=Rhodococcus oxybenzonivorans TaxID=1990687 RepID=A0A2S2C043_9NOCA|nr:hypothetical protein [Rhodococcus oxybenzonivorans]AWK74229.1 hypothetical protein CBI38_24425 [Rhodococcus oxybenzonivorans]
MNILAGTARVVTGAGEAAVATVGAVGGATVGSVVGSLRGTAEGAIGGARYGSHSTPAALLTLGAVGTVGLVEWPLVLAAGGTALVLRQLTPARPKDAGTPAAVSTPTKPTAVPTTRSRAKQTTSGKASGSTLSTVSAQPEP